MAGSSTSKKGSKKIGRAIQKCSLYRTAKKREKNKVRRLKKLLRKAERREWGNVRELKSHIQRIGNSI